MIDRVNEPTADGARNGGLLVGVDLGPSSSAVVEAAARLATALVAPLWIVHVSAPDPDFVGFEAGPQAVRDARAEELHAEHKELQSLAETCRARGLRATALLVQGPTASTLIDEARRRRAGWIVLGSRGRSALGQALGGSIGATVVRATNVPVVIVPPTRD